MPLANRANSLCGRKMAKSHNLSRLKAREHPDGRFVQILEATEMDKYVTAKFRLKRTKDKP